MSTINWKVCHFSSVHTTTDTRVFARECVSLAKHFSVTLIAIGENTGLQQGVNVIAIPKPKSRVLRLMVTTFQVFFKALRVNADIYHIHDAEMIPFGVLFSLLGKKVIYDVHENTYHDISIKTWIPKPLKFLLGTGYRLLEWLTSKTMHTILVIAKPEFADQFKKGNYTVIQNFADIEFLKKYRILSRNQLKQNNIFYIGTLYDTYYNIDIVIEAIYKLKQEGLIVYMKIAGYYGNFLTKRTQLLPYYQEVKEQLDFLGYVSQHTGYLLSQECKIGLCLKDQPEQILVSHERKFFEYMAIGLPILCCDSNIYKEIVEKEQIGLCTNLQDANAVAASIKQLFIDTNLDQLQTNNIHAAENIYNWEKDEVTLIQLYKQLLHIKS
jgi:glycosyltransferase involved in cell wall biosynthesis